MSLAQTPEEERLLKRLASDDMPHWAASAYGIMTLSDLVERGLVEAHGSNFRLTAQARVAMMRDGAE